MQREARSDRGWEQWPGRRTSDESGRSRLRALFLPSEADVATAELVAAHGRDLQEQLAQLRAVVGDLEGRERAVHELEAGVAQLLRHGSVELDQLQHELSQHAEVLERRDRSLSAAEAAVDERRRELGAVELRSAALERRSATFEERESELERRAEELAQLAIELQELGGALGGLEDVDGSLDAHVVLTSDGGYRVRESAGPPPQVGEIVELDGIHHRCVRVTRSPFPADARLCAAVERIPEPEPVSG